MSRFLRAVLRLRLLWSEFDVLLAVMSEAGQIMGWRPRPSRAGEAGSGAPGSDGRPRTWCWGLGSGAAPALWWVEGGGLKDLRGAGCSLGAEWGEALLHTWVSGGVGALMPYRRPWSPGISEPGVRAPKEEAEDAGWAVPCLPVVCPSGTAASIPAGGQGLT